ncbi:MAG: hypothetical protein R2825_24980 [Saprospiraceae bacterium]
MNDIILYEGFFNEKGNFDGLGFLSLRKPISSGFEENKLKAANNMYIRGYAAGIFEDGTFKEGTIANVNNFNEHFSFDKIYPNYTSILTTATGKFKYTNNSKPLFLNFDNYLLEGNAIKHRIKISKLTHDNLAEFYVTEKGNFVNHQLNGEGIQLKENKKGYWEGNFVNGKISEEDKKDQLKAEANASRLKREYTVNNAKFPLGSIVFFAGKNYYVNELFTNGCLTACEMPISKKEYMSKIKPSWATEIYYNSSNILWADPYFSDSYYSTEFCDLSKVSATKLVKCERCSGHGSWVERQAQHGTSTESKTTFQRTYEGVFYDKYENVTTYESKPVTTYNDVKVNCEVCNGTGCH